MSDRGSLHRIVCGTPRPHKSAEASAAPHRSGDVQRCGLAQARRAAQMESTAFDIRQLKQRTGERG